MNVFLVLDDGWKVPVLIFFSSLMSILPWVETTEGENEAGSDNLLA